jgi:hypothetical protein
VHHAHIGRKLGYTGLGLALGIGGTVLAYNKFAKPKAMEEIDIKRSKVPPIPPPPLLKDK